MNKLKKIRFEVISQNILDNIRIREIEFGNLKFYHNNDRSNNINITTDLNFNLNNDGIITNNTTDYNTIVNGDFNDYLIIDKNTAIFQKFIEFDFDLNYDMPNFLNSLSYTKLYWNTPSDIYTDERIYPPYTHQEELIYDFTPYDTVSNWTTYLQTIPNSSSSAPFYSGGTQYPGIFNYPSPDGFISIILPSTYNNLEVTFGNHDQKTNSQRVELLINDVVKSTAYRNEYSKTYTQKYIVGDVLKIIELSSQIHKNLIIKLTNVGDVIDKNPQITPSVSINTIDNANTIIFQNTGGNLTSYDITFPENIICDILIVGGGGGGGTPNGSSYKSGGGGAGGMVYVVSQYLISNITYKIKVGNGGIYHNKGFDSLITDSADNIITIDNIIMQGLGGGAGAPQNISNEAKNGGSGGGGGHYISGGQGLQGNTVWDYASSSYVKGGNDGWNYPSGSSGFHADFGGGAGLNGAGRTVDITGTSIVYATGGDYLGNTTATNGIQHLGNGGNGRFCNSGNCGTSKGGNGGSGIVIIRYKIIESLISYNIQNVIYGNGTYEIDFSTNTHITNHSNYYVFSAVWSDNQYDNGEYIGNEFFNNLGYYGDWITIKMPVNIIPTKIRFVSILLNSSHTNRLPKKYRLYGYFNNVWELILDDYVEDNYEYETYNYIHNIAYTKNIQNAKNYNKYALIVNKIGTSNYLAMSNFEIFGREIINDKLINNDISSVPVITPFVPINILDDNYKYIVFQNTGNNQTSYSITFSQNTTCDILIIGGGGSGGRSMSANRGGGGGGAGGLIYISSTILSADTYTLKVGNGGIGTSSGQNGYDSSIVSISSSTITTPTINYLAYGGGRGGNVIGGGGSSGGSGGGGSDYNGSGGTSINGGGAGTTYVYGFNGGQASQPSGYYSGGSGAGGGGAGGLGQNASGYSIGNGGSSKNIDITGTLIQYAKGGDGGLYSGGTGTNGENNIGNGGGGAGRYGTQLGGNGGSGVVIIKYRLQEQLINNDISSDPVTTPITSINTLDSKYKYVVFQNTGDNQSPYNITFTESTACDILIVGGGGSGGVRDAGAGGAGGLIYLNNVNILNSNLSVGKGGASRTSGGHISGDKGNDSSMVINSITYTAIGGGKGGQWNGSNNSTGSGGSGGGGGGNNSEGGAGNQSSSASGGYGNDGAKGSGSYSGGGGGGAGGAGTRHSGDTGGNGGIGIDLSAIFGTDYGENGWFAGGGGMGSGSGANGTGGLGGGGNGANSGAAEGGMDGTGGGGGGHRSSGGTSGKGGDGIIIIRYSYNNQSLNFLELKTKILDNDDNIIELNNTVLNSEELIHGIKNGIMTSYNMTKYVLFKEERLYPPYYKSEILLFENFFIENKIYGNGQYKIEYSSTYSDNNKPLNIFRNNYYNGMWQSNSYTWNNKPLNTLLARSLFNGNGTSYLKDESDESYIGEWITINLPYKILLTKIILALLDSNSLNISTYDNAIYYFPHDFRIYGKNNNDEEWELIIHKNIDKTNLNNKYDNENNLNVAFEYKLTDNDRLTKFKTFENYGLVVSQIGGKEYLNFSKWDIYGRELTSILDNKPDNIPSKKNIKFSQLSKVFDDEFDNKNIKITNYYLDNLVYDFSSQTSLNEWIDYVEEIGGTTNISHYYAASQLSGSHGNEHGVFKGGAEIGYFDLPLPSRFNKIKITFRNVYNKADGVVKIKIGGDVINEQIGMSATETTQWITYNEGDHFRIEEGHSIWSANLKLEFTNNENLGRYDYNISIPNDGIISLSDFKSTSSFIDNIPFVDNIYARYETKYESLYISDNIVKQWYDSSGNNRHIITYRGNPIVKYFERGTKGTIGKNYFNVIKGDYNSGYKLPFRLNFDYTFCYIARYVGNKNNTTYNRRIFDSSSGTGQDTRWGFHDNHSGRSHNYKSGWHTTTHKQHSETDYWMIGIETQNTARYNGQDCTNYYEYKGINYPQKHSDYNVQLTINYGYYTGETYSTETSNWEIAEMIFYNKELNLDEKINIEQYLAKKCGHISFSSVVDNLEDYKTIIKSQNYINDLSDMWYYVYDGYKYGYSDLTDKFYGPVNFRFNLYKYINDDDITKYYWIADFINTTSTDGNTSYSNRNVNIKTYNIKILKTDATINIVSGGGGGGGGNNYWDWISGGGGAGGQSHIYNYLQTSDTNYNIQVGSKGNGHTNNSSGGDSIVSWVDDNIQYNITGNGGEEGEGYSQRGQGGSYNISPSNLPNMGGDVGGNSIQQNLYGHIYYARNPGGKISTQLQTITLNSDVTFWNILDDFFPNWDSRNVAYHWTASRYYGAGGPGGQNYRSGTPDKSARSSYAGGPGYIFMILDFNDIENATSNTNNTSSIEDNTNSSSSY